MAGHPLRPAIRRRHGRPLPHRLADGTQPHPKAFPLQAPHEGTAHPVLATLSSGYSRLWGRSVTCYSPVRHYQSEDRPFDLHVLSTPPAFTLSQDQTLHKMAQLSSPHADCTSISFTPSCAWLSSLAALHESGDLRGEIRSYHPVRWPCSRISTPVMLPASLEAQKRYRTSLTLSIPSRGADGL